MSGQDDAFALLWRLLEFDGPSGDEGALADWLMTDLAQALPDVRLERWGDSVIALRGERPSVALFAHIDTTGWTLGYDKELIPIGSPAEKSGDPVRPAGVLAAGNRLRFQEGTARLSGKTDAVPGSRWVYAGKPVVEGEEIVAPYLDNRAGVWAALQALSRCPEIAVAFTVGEEHSGYGACVCARRLFEGFGIRRALISDITWHTKHVHCGKGVAISLRDKMMPRQRFLERILALAETSGLSYQREIESSGGSDGGYLQRSGLPWEWVFVGAPEKYPHSSAERVHRQDLLEMAAMLTFLVNALHGEREER